MKNITLEDKLKLFIGKSTWEFNGNKDLNIRSLRVNDGPHGLRKIIFDDSQRKETTCFPTAVNLASTFNPSLIKKVGKSIALECIEAKVHVILGPGINLKRTPLGGRCFEYYSEDPYLTGVTAKAFIEGVQSQKVGTSLKHFICNEQEYYRLTSSSEVDDLAFYNLYLKAFKIALKAKPTTVMASYNKLNGTYTTENKKLLIDILRNSLKYDGIVISDWGAINSLSEAIKNGTNIEMPYSGEERLEILKKAYHDGVLTDEIINKRIKEIQSIQNRIYDESVDYYAPLDVHHKLSKKVSDESIILLKNDGSLPLDKKKKTLFVGEFCNNLIIQATGSAKVAYPNKTEINSYLESKKYPFAYLKGYKINEENVDETLEKQVLDAATNYDQVVMLMGLYEGLEGEGYDRFSYNLPKNQLHLLNKLISLGIKVNVVLVGGSAVALPFNDDVASLINAYLPGESGAESIIDILYGDINPSGRLSETYAISLSDIPAAKYNAGNNAVNYKESVYIGYRYFDKANVNVLYPFGYGLSYSKFEYSNFNVSLYNGTLDITNATNRSGKDVIQVYLRKPNSNHLAPIKELVAIKKVKVDAFKTKKVSYKISQDELKTYVSQYKKYVLLDGEYEVFICSDANTILYSTKFYVNSSYKFNEYPVPSWYLSPNDNMISDEDFAVILGRKVAPVVKKPKQFSINTSLEEFKDTLSGRDIYQKEVEFVSGIYPNDGVVKDNQMRANLSSPIKCKAIFDGNVSWSDVYQIIDKSNEELKLNVRTATIEDLDKVLEIYNDAIGKFEVEGTYQWKRGYPNKDTFIDDIKNNKIFACTRLGEIVGVITAILGGEADYDVIDGKWLNDEDYLTIHRVAVKKEYLGYGVASALFDYAKKYAKSQGLNNIRIDTHERNNDMKKLLSRHGFKMCGVITLRKKQELRDAYQLKL